MCALVGSGEKKMLNFLYDVNSYRGQLSYSVSTISRDSEILSLTQAAGKMPEGFIFELPDAHFYIGHSQAPTTESTSIHPAKFKDAMLWHNGIVKQREIPDGVWDTEWMLKGIVTDGFGFLSTVTGSFACVLFMQNQLFIFRNEISPLFVDKDLNISSTKFHGGEPITPNVVYQLNLKEMTMVEVAQFETRENPYFFG